MSNVLAARQREGSGALPDPSRTFIDPTLALDERLDGSVQPLNASATRSARDHLLVLSTLDLGWGGDAPNDDGECRNADRGGVALEFQREASGLPGLPSALPSMTTL